MVLQVPSNFQQRVQQHQPSFPTFDRLLLSTVFIKMSGIAALLEAAKYIDMCKRSTTKEWQDVPDEILLKILSYLEVKDLISCGQVSKRTRNISRDHSLYVTINLQNKIVKIELLEMILSKGCKILNLSSSNVVGRFSSNIKSQLRVLNWSWFTSIAGSGILYRKH